MSLYVFQRSVLGNDSVNNHGLREYFAHLDSVYNTSLPKASPQAETWWKSRLDFYWKLSLYNSGQSNVNPLVK